jgi:thioredoxin-dependent peroxiredoxin
MRLARRLAAVSALSLITMSTTHADPPKVGDAAPDITLKATQIKKALPDSKADAISLKDLKGKTVVLFWYPKAMTKGCTIESCGFRDLIPEFDKANTVVVGFSPDTLEAQQQFTEKEKLNFPLLADADKKLHAAMGVQKRSTWVIDKDGNIVKFYDTVTVDKHPKEVLEFVKTLK